MSWLIGISILGLLIGFGCTVFLELEREEDRCDTIMKEIVSEDRATVTDETPSRLHSTWLSQECEIRAGPEHIIRKYSFFANGTFVLLRYHYAEESCSIATYTVVARGSIEISSASITVPGASEANVRLDSVRLIPFNRQVAHKFGRRLNSSCGGIEKKWRPYSAQLIYERRPSDVSSNTSVREHELNSNSFESRLPRARKNRGTLDCLEYLGIEFTELGLLRVERRRSDSPRIGSSTRDPAETDENKMPRIRVELLLGELARNGRSESPPTEVAQRPNRLQSAPLLRADTALGCPICGTVLRATEYSPPLFHQAPPLPAVIGGLWLSVRCESVDEGLWSRRFFRIYSGDNRWSARWTYYADSTCSILLYTVTVAGTYVQRPVGRKRDDAASVRRRRRRVDGFDRVRLGRPSRPRVPTPLSNQNRPILPGSVESMTTTGSLASVIPRESRREKPETVRLDFTDRIAFLLSPEHTALPSGTSKLELLVTESRSIPLDETTSTRCEPATKRVTSTRPKDCVPRAVEAPTILTYKARIGLDWNGDYILLLASWKDDLWQPPLRRCSETISQNYFRTNAGRFFSSQRYDRLFNRRGRYWFSSSSASCLSASSCLRVVVVLSCWLLVLYRRHELKIT